MPLFDGDAEVQVIFGETDITGSNSQKAAVLIGGVSPTNTASFLQTDEFGHLNVTGSVAISESVPLTIGSFGANVTSSVRLVATDVIQEVTGTIGITSIASPVTVGNFPTVQTVTGSVVLGEQPVDVTGSVGISEVVDVTGSVEITSIASPVTVTGSVILGEEPIEITGSATINSIITPVDQGDAGVQAEGWFARITDGSQVLGTGSSAPVYTSGSVHVQNFPPVQTVTGSVVLGEQPINITGSATINSVITPIDQGNAGTQAEGWYARITDGTKVLGTGSSAPFHITGSVGARDLPIKGQPLGRTDAVLINPGEYHETSYGHTRVAVPQTYFDNSSRLGIEPLEFGISSSNAGQVTFVSASKAIRLSVPPDTNSSAFLRTHTNFPFQAGKVAVAKIVTKISGANDNRIMRFGLSDGDDSFQYEYSGSNVNLLSINTAPGFPVVTRISQSNWNVDTFDGNGPSGIVLDSTLFNRFEVHLQWASTGESRFFINGHLAHVGQSANLSPFPYIGQNSLPLNLEVQNQGSTSVSGVLEMGAISFEVENGHPPPQFIYGKTIVTGAVVDSTETHVFSMRPALTHNGFRNTSIILPQTAIVTTDGARILYTIYLNLGVNSVAWTKVGGASTAEVLDVPTTAISGGVSIFQAILPNSSDAIVLPLDKYFDFDARKLRRRAFVDVADTISITAKNLKGGVTDVRAGFNWTEIR